MKKLFTLMAAAFVLMAGACKKDKQENTSADNSWTLNGVKHTVAFSNKSETSGGTPTTLIIFADGIPSGAASNVNTFNISFKKAPAATGTYQLVGGVGGTLTDNQFELFAGGPEGVYAYLGDKLDVNITVTNGKVKVTFPEISLKSTTSAPDAKLTAAVYEK